MGTFWKIPKEWVTDWGLSHTEAIVLADIQSWPECSHEERAKRVGLSARQLTRVKDKMSSNVRTKCLMELGQNVLRKRTKCPKNLEKKENPPLIPPIKEKKELLKNIEEILPSASDGVKGMRKKYTLEEQKFHGELRDIFLAEWKLRNGDDFEMNGANMAAIIKLKNSLKFKLKSDGYNSDDPQYLKDLFQHFIKKTLNGDAGEFFINKDPKTIASQFNTIYTTLRNGKSNSNTNTTNRHQPRFSAEFLADIANGLAGGN